MMSLSGHNATPAFMTSPHALHEADPYLEPGHAVTELSLRNQILTIFSELRLKPHNGALGQTLLRYWQDRRLPTADLAIALELALRDGYLVECQDGAESFPELSEAGEAYLAAAPTPRALAVLAPHMGMLGSSVSLSVLDRLTLALFARNKVQDFVSLKYGWRLTGLDLNALLHGLDRLHKQQRIELTDDDPLCFKLS